MNCYCIAYGLNDRISSVELLSMGLTEMSSFLDSFEISVTKYSLKASDSAGNAESVSKGCSIPTLHSCPKIIFIAWHGGSHL